MVKDDDGQTRPWSPSLLLFDSLSLDFSLSLELEEEKINWLTQ